ncbi:MAG: DUF1016 family protein [Paludibacteraceae bacterium]|nr:DUF1016 family protein [Paludibacteraceae bacterium]
MANIEKKDEQPLKAQISENEYKELLRQTVAVIENARASIALHLAVTTSNTHWEIGKLLNKKKLESQHGSGVVKRLSVDLKERYPDMGLSPRNLWDMKKFYLRYCDSDTKLRQSVALLPWSHNLLLMRELKDNDAAIYYYARETVSKGWNRDLLLNAIKLGMHETHPVETPANNFDSTLPAVQSQYANEVFRSTYNLGFLGVTKPILELELENRLVEKIKLFLLELGKGFSFIGNQHTIEYNGKESRVDMLFFHRGLRCLVAIDLKIGKFIPEYAGKMNYYLSLLDRTERQEGENPSIGIILCAEKDNLEVELALEGITKPIGVADYQLIIPKDELQKAITAEIQSFEEEQEHPKDLDNN